MSFLFKSSKRGQERSTPSREGQNGSQGSIQASAGKSSGSQARSTPTGSLNSLENEGVVASPDKPTHRRGASSDQTAPSDLPFRNGPQATNSNPNSSLYPWSQRRMTFTSSHPPPFPRYGSAVNSVSSKEGDVYMMGGLINSSTVKGDLWMIEAGGNMACYPIATTAEGPGPRVGHAALLVGNAFIVYGGDTKIDESDVLDETLYLLNTSTRQWSRALPAGPRPSGRYGHSLNILGSKIFIFGGQVEGYFMNDLSAFDLNQLQMPNNRWELLLSADSPVTLPAPRTNHSMITHNDKMYLFGGTNGFQWFNDVWCYDLAANAWTAQDCIGYIPAPREGHAAALVDDVMYIFGGRTEDGTDLGDLAAFKISTRRWYTFQNMGPSPSPRSGHSMTTVGKSIVVLGGEPSSASTTINDLSILYILDTTKIRYPNDAAQNTPQQKVQGRRPSAGEANGIVPRQMPTRDGSLGPDPRKGPPLNGAMGSNGYKSPPPNAAGPEAGSPVTSGSGPGIPAATNSRLPRAAQTNGPAGPPPPGPAPAKPVGDPAALNRNRGPSLDRSLASPPPPTGAFGAATNGRDMSLESEGQQVNGRRTPTQPLARSNSKHDPSSTSKPLRQGRSQGSTDGSAEPIIKTTIPRTGSPPPATRQTSNPISRRSSQRNSQTVVLLKELDSARNKNAWYASELELARKAGYVSNVAAGTGLDPKAAETFEEEDRPLIEALLSMRAELANVQSAVDKQAVVASRQIAEVERQRDAAIQEAVNAKAKLAAQLGGTIPAPRDVDLSADRSEDASRKLASALHAHKQLQAQLESLKSDLQSERKARQLADDTATATQRRIADLESYKQQTSAEVERLKSELHISQKEAREHSVAASEAGGALELLKVEKKDIESKYNDAVGSTKDHSTTFESLRNAIAASQEAHSHLESKLDEERLSREKTETQFNQLKVEHEARTAELVSATQRLRDAEEIAEKHAAEARTHRQAVLNGLDKISAKDGSESSTAADAERATVLQNQVAAANALVKQYQQEADTVADKLRSAEERIAGLEQYQEQSSREGVGIRRQLQSAMRETQSLQASHSELRNKLAAQQLETNAITVQHNALKDILAERGISPTAAARTRNLTSPQSGSPDTGRLRELETLLASAAAAHDETKQNFALQAQESESAYRDKLSQLESDYQSAVHYVRGTEKMLKQLKDQSARYKQDNTRLKSEVVDLEDKLQAVAESSTSPSHWEMERHQLQTRIESLELEMHEAGADLQRNLDSVRAELQESNRQRDDAAGKLHLRDTELEQLHSENSLLEQRATDAEQKVSLLLDQVESSVDNYRRQSRQAPFPEAELRAVPNGAGHTRDESSEAGSVYGGNTNGPDARNSAALDNLASELETLRTHWEATNKNYRLSTNFEFDPPSRSHKEEENGVGLSESLADWRKRLDSEEHSKRDQPQLG